MATIPETLNFALEHHRAGRLQEAEVLYRQILQEHPNHADALHRLGLIAHHVGRHEAAVELIGKAIAVNPAVAEFHNNIGEAYRMQGKWNEAVSCYRRAVEIKPDYPEPYHNLGVVFYEQGDLGEAIGSYRQALALNPGSAGACNGLGVALAAQGKLDEAVACLRQALALKPGHAETYSNLGLVLRGQGKVDEAIAHYRQAVALKPADADGHVHLGNLLKDQGKLEEAGECYRQALAIRPHDGLRIKIATMLPVILPSTQDVSATRTKFEDNIEALLKEELTLKDPVQEVGQTNFYLAYHGRNNLDLLVKMAEIYERACPSLLYTAPHCASWRGVPKGSKIKIGFLSRFFKIHSVAKAARGVLAMLSREKFDVTALFVPPVVEDEIAAFIRRRADHTIDLPGSLQAARERIAEEAFDILFYQDIGMDPFTYFLAFARLAPVQCVFFGHGETSGIRNLDYYISAENIEPDNAQAHYSERLIKLKSPCAYYYKPAVPVSLKPRSAFGLDDADHVYLCPQSLFKFHPEFDGILAGILETDPRAKLALKIGPEPYWEVLLMRRFSLTMRHLMDRITVLPPQPEEDFINLMAVSDVMLDTRHYSGYTTSLEAFAAGTPVVTWPGEFHCGRLTLSLYHEMGMHDCVADSPSDYVKIAVRLGTDAMYRKKIKAKILKNNHRLFENRQVVKEYERVFLAMMKAAGAPLSARSRSKKYEQGGERAMIPKAVKKTLRKKKSRR